MGEFYTRPVKKDLSTRCLWRSLLSRASLSRGLSLVHHAFRVYNTSLGNFAAGAAALVKGLQVLLHGFFPIAFPIGSI